MQPYRRGDAIGAFSADSRRRTVLQSASGRPAEGASEVISLGNCDTARLGVDAAICAEAREGENTSGRSDISPAGNEEEVGEWLVSALGISGGKEIKPLLTIDSEEEKV